MSVLMETVVALKCDCHSGFVLDDDGATSNGMYTNVSIYDWLCKNQSFLSAIFHKK